MAGSVVGERPTRILLFTGKGGVGKTTLACATAIQLADRGHAVLLVSTDPASNLDEVLETRLTSSIGPGTCPVAVKGVPNLWALNIDPDAAASAYRERAIGPYRDVLPASAIASMEEQLAGACATEIAVFDEFTRLLGDPSASQGFAHIIFDTAPTGHTLRLLKLPAAWTEFMATNATGNSCLGSLAGLAGQRRMYEASLSALQDSTLTTIMLVSRPDTSALREADRTCKELNACGIRNIRLVLNGMFKASNPVDVVASAYERRIQQSLDRIPCQLLTFPRSYVPMLGFAPIGADALRRVFHDSDSRDTSNSAVSLHAAAGIELKELMSRLGEAGRGVILVMGKGGVGKTTIASAIAVALASQGHRVHLSTTDPAAHVSQTLSGTIPGLTISRIDPAEEIRRYSEEVMAVAGAGLDDGGRALLEEDLRSPCTEEIAVFRAFAECVAAGEQGFVVLDTAPTGHTLLLLDAAKAYHREVERSSAAVPDSVRRLLERLRDPNFTRVIIVTLPEATPVHEAIRLADDLKRAGIQPLAWVVNQSLLGLHTEDPVLVSKTKRESQFIGEVQRYQGPLVSIVPWQKQAPVGESALKKLAANWFSFS